MKMLNDQEYAHLMLCLKSLQERCKRYETTILKQEAIIKEDERKEKAYKREIEFWEDNESVKGYYEGEIKKVENEIEIRKKREKELEHAVRGKKIALRELNKAMNKKNEQINELRIANGRLIETVNVISEEYYKETGTHISYNIMSKVLTKVFNFHYYPEGGN